MENDYIFKSERLGFRNWIDSDLLKMSTINADEDVMKFFPKINSEKETLKFIKRMQEQYSKSGFCYFAVDKLTDGKFIGFIGLSKQTFKSEFTPFIDIGWRIDKMEWNNGYATEGALRCLEFAKNNLKLDLIYATAPIVNTNSIKVMEKTGMEKVETFHHPLLLSHKELKECVLYKIKLG